MPGEGMQRNNITYSAAISECEEGEQWQRALVLYGRMLDERAQRDTITYSAASSSVWEGDQPIIRGRAGMSKNRLRAAKVEKKGKDGAILLHCQRLILNNSLEYDIKGRMVRYYCIDFETNGFPPKGAAMCHELPLPFSSMPIQVSVDIVESSGVVEHAYDAIILGATRLCPWVVQNVPIPMSAVLSGKPLVKVADELDALLHPEDVIVAHNVAFDMDLALARTCERMDIASTTLRRLLAAPRFCTMRCSYSRSVFGRQPKLKDLCEHFGVELTQAHDARGDSAALAQCVSCAIHRGVMLEGALR